MADKKPLVPLVFPQADPIAATEPQERKSKLFSGRTELLIVYGFIAISTYLTVRLALQTSRLADFNTLHERSITLINQQLKDQAGHLAAFERTDHEVIKSLNDTNSRNGRIEKRLGQIEDDHMALKRANARILASEQTVRERLDALNTRMAQDNSTTVYVPVAPSAATPANHTHQYASGLTPPPGTQVYTNAQNEQIWQTSKDGKQQQLRPIEQTSLGYLVHNLTDGQDYTLTPKGDWLPGSAK
jgi:septal ring factor EnvC (AmiA/AmiB activator)